MLVQLQTWSYTFDSRKSYKYTKISSIYILKNILQHGPYLHDHMATFFLLDYITQTNFFQVGDRKKIRAT